MIEQAAVLSALGSLPQTVEALVGGESGVRPGPCFGIPASFASFTDLSLRAPRVCVRELINAVDLSQLPSSRTTFVYCVAKGDLQALEEIAEGKEVPSLPAPFPAGQARALREAFGLGNGPVMAVSNACASGTIGVEIASELLATERADHVVLFGFESLCRFVATGFHSLGAVSPTRARPFDRDRDGLTLGEGAAVAVIGRRETRNGDTFVAGAGSSNDANHRTGPSRTGEGLHNAASAALRDAGLKPKQIGAVKCHGTATAYNDAMEAKALIRLFDDAVPPCASIKGALGHTSGGGSLLEILVAAECLRNAVLPPTTGYSNHGVDEPVPISSSLQPIRQPAILCLSAGFGGVNAAAVVGVAS